MEKILIPLYDNEVAPRFDLATDVLVVSARRENGRMTSAGEKIVVLAQASAEEVCRLVMAEDVQAVICGGIEDEYHQFLTWKGVKVYDGVIGDVDVVVAKFLAGAVEPGADFSGRQG